MAEKQNTPQLQNTSDIDTDVFVKGMTKDPDASMITKEQWSHARNAINNSVDGDLGTLGNEPANKQCTSAPFTIIGAIHLYGDKWVLFSTNNEQSEIGTWDDSECKYERIVNDYSCYQCIEDSSNTGQPSQFLNFNTQHLITGASKENFDCSWQVYWDDGINPSRTLNLDNIPWKQKVVSDEGADCVIYEDIEPLCIDTEKIRLAPLIDIPCIKLSKSKDGGQLRNGSYQVFIAYTINDQKIGDYFGISNIQPLFEHEDMLSGLEIEISNLDKEFEFYELVICSHNQGEQQAKQIGFYSTEQTNISIDYINQKLPAAPLSTLPLTTPAYEKSDKMYVVNDYLIRQGPTEQFDFNYQPLANQIHTHWTVTQFPNDYYKKGGNKTTFMRDEVYSFFIRFIYNTGEKSASYHIPGRGPQVGGGGASPFLGVQDAAGNNPNVLDPWPGNNDLGTASWNQGNQLGTPVVDRVFEVYNTADDGWGVPYAWAGAVMPNTLTNNIQTGDGGTVIREGHMAYWESTERYPQDPVRWGDLCGQPIRHHKMPDETTAYTALVNNNTANVTANNFLDRTGQNNQTINVLGVTFSNIEWPRFNASTDADCGPDDPSPTGARIPNIVGYEILVGSREGNKSIIAKGITRNMKQYNMPNTATGHEIGTGALTGYYANYPFNDPGPDVYLHGGANNSWRGGAIGQGNIVNSANPYPAANTSTNLYTFHSPETSFNKPFLSPYELKSYGLCTGTSLGRFRPSEKHPQHKLLRNISMWVAIFVGIGYAISELRGKRSKTEVRPKALSVGLGGKGGRNANPVGLPWLMADVGAGAASSVPDTVSYPATLGVAQGLGTSTMFGVDNSSVSAAPWGNSLNPLTGAAIPDDDNFLITNRLATNVGTRMMLNYNTSQQALGAEGAANIGLTTASMVGAPKLAKQGVLFLGYEPATRTNFGQLGINRGFIGAGEDVQFEGSRYESLPSLAQFFFGMYNFMAFTAEGGQVIIDLIYNLVSYQDYAWKYSGQGLYWSTQQINQGSVFRQLINKGRYVGAAMQNLTANIRINNVQRPKTVVLDTITNGADFQLPGQGNGFADNSREIIGSFGGHFNPSQYRLQPIAAHYCALKVNFRNQYGQIDQIKQVPTGCITYFDDQLIYDDKGEILPWDDDNTRNFTTPPVYGGDCYIGRYNEKVIMPFFWDFMLGQPDGFPYDYKLRANVPRPIYWMDTKKYELSELVRQITGLGFIGNIFNPASGSNLAAATPSGLYFLDRPFGDALEDDGSDANAATGGVAGAGSGPSQANPPQQGAPDTDRGGRSVFHVKNGYMYTHCNGINEFYAESTINVDLRDWEDVDEKRHFDIVEYTDVEALFHADIIKKDNFYKYDSSLSKSRFNTQLISYGFIQLREYDPLVAEDCYTHYPKRLMYSLQAQLEAKKDFWRVFLPYNYKDFKNKVNVIKPVSKSGAMILFPHLSPVLWQGVDQLETDLGTKLTIGDGGLFSQPPQAIVNADLPHEYGSCESARSVVNTPSGLFFISQQQGKIFHYTQSLSNIADQGMKQWFNKYLPSILLKQFPEMEHCDSWIDNPVAGVGCQSVYDPNYDLVYFSKKDYECTSECVDYVPCEGFVYNNTRCNNYPPTPCCPEGYTFNPSGPTCPPGWNLVSCLNGDPCCKDPITGQLLPAEISEEDCEMITTEPAIVDEHGGLVDIVFAVDSSNSVGARGNTGNMQNFVRTFVDELENNNLVSNGSVRVGFVHFGGGRANENPLFNGQTTGGANPDEMFNPNNQLLLTNDMTLVNSWIGFPSPWDPLYDTTGGYPPDLTSIYGSATGGLAGTTPPRDLPHGTDILGGIWCAQNLLYGIGSRVVPKVLITIFDGPMSVHNANDLFPSCRFFYTSTPYISGGIGDGVTQSDVLAPLSGGPSMQVPDPALAGSGALATPDVDWPVCPPTNTASGFSASAFSYDSTWFDTNVRNGYTQLAPFNQRSYSVIVNPNNQPNEAPTTNQEIYAERFAGGGGLTPQAGQYGGDFQNTNEIVAIAQEIIDAITPPPTITCPPGCTLITTTAGQYYCECVETVPVEWKDSVVPVDIYDETLFKDVSWTVSYDPKYKAWMSFHDWHPELMIPSLNHFFTTNTYEDLESQPSCPPEFTWNPSTQTCCQTFQGEYEAAIIVDEVPVEVVTTAVDCKLDIVIACDTSGSMQGNNWTAARTFIRDFVCTLSPDMIAGNTQIGLIYWSSSTTGGIQFQTPRAIVGTDSYGNTYLQTAASISDDDRVTMTNNPEFDDNGNCTFGLDNHPGQANWGTDMALGYNTAISVISNVSGTAQTPNLNANGLWNIPEGSALGDRTTDAGYRRIIVFLGDGDNNGGAPNGCSNIGSVAAPFGSLAANAGMNVEGNNVVIFASPGGGLPNNAVGFNQVSCQPNNAPFGFIADQWLVDSNANCDPQTNCPSTVANSISSNLCTLPPVCNCPDGYERISSNLDGSAPPHIVLGPTVDCSEGKEGVCRKLECDCDVDNLPIPTIPVTQTGLCPTDILNGIALYYNSVTNVGDSTWVNPDPLICHYDYECCIEGVTQRGGIWKHNDRCDLFANYYGKDYPWEVEWVETVGQTVNTVRSIEYQLESYIYKGNLADDCGDRFHDLDWNFDEAIIHNTEQVSGLLKLNLDPKNNVPLITEYPIITANDIEILYSKVEQKYRFNQFWDITRDRGEFDANWNSSIFITQLNGYIRDLNQANLNYLKPALQRKKFRHYWNKVILRKNISGNRKMIFKLANTKINASFR